MGLAAVAGSLLLLTMAPGGAHLGSLFVMTIIHFGRSTEVLGLLSMGAEGTL